MVRIVLIASAVIAWYTASAMVLSATTRRVVLPVGRRGGPLKPGSVSRHPVEYTAGDPGVKIGQ